MKFIKMKIAFIFFLALASLYSFSFTVSAQGDLAMAGTFSGWKFNIPQGAEVASDDVFVVIFNNTEDEVVFNMAYTAPQGVDVSFSDDKFTVEPGANHRVIPTVKVTNLATPGQYELIITAKATVLLETGGVGVSTALGQKAILNIAGESAAVKIQAVSPESAPLVITVNLFRLDSNQSYEVASSETGVLDTKVAPGNFVASAYIGGEKVAEESFSTIAGENKTITLSAATIYFEGFGIVPNYQKDTGELAFAKVVYTVSNLYKAVEKADVVLDVSLEGKSLEEITLANLTHLDIGRSGLNYNYIPNSGWQSGTYSFKLGLNLDGEPYTSSNEQTLNVNAAENAKGNMLPVIIGIAAAAVVIISGVLFILFRKLGRR